MRPRLKAAKVEDAPLGTAEKKKYAGGSIEAENYSPWTIGEVGRRGSPSFASRRNRRDVCHPGLRITSSSPCKGEKGRESGWKMLWLFRR